VWAEGYAHRFVGQPPLPPHERPWRHPSEVAADITAEIRREPAPTHVRTAAAVTGIGGLLVIAVAVLVVTPRGGDDPPAATSGSALVTVAPAGLSVPTAAAARPLATPVADGVALAAASTFDEVDRRVVDLPDGSRVTADVVERLDHVVVVRLASSGAEPWPINDDLPARSDPVTAMAPDPVATTLRDIGGLDLAHGTPVVDDRGHLVAICDGSTDGVSPIDDDVVAAIASAAPPP
jgi:hypothetical protein